jgi:SAM-dependent methyltransferase
MSGALTTREMFYSRALATAHAQAYNDTFKPAQSWFAHRIQGSAARPYFFDMGCGDGAFLAAMGEMGFFGEGIDISAAFVGMAHKRGVEARQDSAASAPIPPNTTAITALGEVLAYEPAALAPVVLAASRRLPSGGVLIFDMPGPETPAGENTSSGQGWSLNARVSIEGATLTREIDMVFEKRKVVEIHKQRLFSPDEVREIVEGFGFTCELGDSYGPCPLLPGRFSVVARKP